MTFTVIHSGRDDGVDERLLWGRYSRIVGFVEAGEAVKAPPSDTLETYVNTQIRRKDNASDWHVVTRRGISSLSRTDGQSLPNTDVPSLEPAQNNSVF